MKKTLIVFLSIATLSACNTTPVWQLSYTEKKVLVNQIINRCLKQGIRMGSKEMDPCTRAELAREIAVRQENSNAARGMALGLAGGMGAMSQGYYNAANTYRPPVTCTSRPGGTFVGRPSYMTTTCQ